MHKLQHCLGARGKRGKIKADHVNCPKNFVLHCSYQKVIGSSLVGVVWTFSSELPVS